MSLADEVAKRRALERAEAARRANPELEAKLDRFIDANPQIREHYATMTKEEIVRRMMLAKMERAEATVRASQELKHWVAENPEIVAKVQERVKSTAAENRQGLGIEAGKTEAAKQTTGGPRFRM